MKLNELQNKMKPETVHIYTKNNIAIDCPFELMMKYVGESEISLAYKDGNAEPEIKLNMDDKELLELMLKIEKEKERLKDLRIKKRDAENELNVLAMISILIFLDIYVILIQRYSDMETAVIMLFLFALWFFACIVPKLIKFRNKIS